MTPQNWFILLKCMEACEECEYCFNDACNCGRVGNTKLDVAEHGTMIQVGWTGMNLIHVTYL